jgi:hypothetical protein
MWIKEYLISYGRKMNNLFPPHSELPHWGFLMSSGRFGLSILIIAALLSGPALRVSGGKQDTPKTAKLPIQEKWKADRIPNNMYPLLR